MLTVHTTMGKEFTKWELRLIIISPWCNLVKVWNRCREGLKP